MLLGRTDGGCTAADLALRVSRRGPVLGTPVKGSIGLWDLSRLKERLRSHGLHPRKSLGQNFLVDPQALRQIVDAASLDDRDLVLEIGPGPGVLTELLLQRVGRVIVVEKDQRMAALLSDLLGSDNKLSIHVGDVLELGTEPLLAKVVTDVNDTGYKVVANLPYYVATAIVRHFLEASIKPKVMVVLLQKEVAEGLVGMAGKRSILSVATELYARPSIIGVVKAASFYPQPKVDSAIVRLDVLDSPAVDVDPALFFLVVHAGFAAPRKTVLNSLAIGMRWEKSQTVEALSVAGVAGSRRAETLTLEEWAKLTSVVAPMIGS